MNRSWRGGQDVPVAQLASTVEAVLDREPTAVATALAALPARRDAAAAAQGSG